MEIEDVYITKCGEDRDYETYFVEFELVNDTAENVAKWEEFFGKCKHYKLKLTIEPIQEKWLV